MVSGKPRRLSRAAQPIKTMSFFNYVILGLPEFQVFVYSLESSEERIGDILQHICEKFEDSSCERYLSSRSEFWVVRKHENSQLYQVLTSPVERTDSL